MRTLCPKPGKGGKIHPSPVEDPIRAAFRLLPAAILVLVAGLRAEDREVLAYLVTCPVEAAAAVPPSQQAAAAARGGGGRGGGGGRRRVGYTPASWAVGHPPTHGCGCVDCYISFWARWELSPERDRILDAVSAFEEHLAATAATPLSSPKRRDRGRRSRLPATPPPPMPVRRPKSPEPKAVEVVQEPASPLPLPCPPPPPPPAPASCIADEEEEENVVPEPAAEAEAKEELCEVAAEEERKRGWADVVMGGVLGRRLWGIWGPAVESAT